MRENIRLRGVALLFALALCALRAVAQDATTAKIDEFINAEMQRQKIPGVSLAVVRDGRIIYAKGYGYANVEHQVPVKPETIFQSGSVGKQFTAMAVMMLAEEGKLGPDLTHVGSRLYLGAGTLLNQPGGMAHWIAHTQAVKPGARMPSSSDMDAQTLAALAVWLEQLK